MHAAHEREQVGQDVPGGWSGDVVSSSVASISFHLASLSLTKSKVQYEPVRPKAKAARKWPIVDGIVFSYVIFQV